MYKSKNMIKILKINDKLVLLSAILLFVFLRPYFVWSFFYIPFIRIGLLALLCFIFYRNREKTITKKSLFLVFLFSFTVLMSVFVQISHGNVNLFGSLDAFSNLFLVTFILSSKEFRLNVYDSFLSVYSIIVFISLVVWLLLPFGFVPELGIISSNDAENRSFILYPFLVTECGFDALRFNGPFDEPGVVGTIGAILLCANNFNLKDKRSLLVLVSSFFSLSFFFYVIISIYTIFYFVLVKKKFFVVLLLLGLLSVFYQYTKNNPLFYSTIWERAEWDPENYEFKGDNRSNPEADILFNSKRGTSEYYWGFDNIDLYNSYAKGSCTYKNVVASHGIVFFVLYCLFFIRLAYYRGINMGAFALYCLVLFANLYQRPNVYSPYIIFLFIMFSDSIINKKESLIK